MCFVKHGGTLVEHIVEVMLWLWASSNWLFWLLTSWIYHENPGMANECWCWWTPKKTVFFSMVQYDSNICESEVLQYSTSFGTKKVRSFLRCQNLRVVSIFDSKKFQWQTELHKLRMDSTWITECWMYGKSWRSAASWYNHLLRGGEDVADVATFLIRTLRMLKLGRVSKV